LIPTNPIAATPKVRRIPPKKLHPSKCPPLGSGGGTGAADVAGASVVVDDVVVDEDDVFVSVVVEVGVVVVEVVESVLVSVDVVVTGVVVLSVGGRVVTSGTPPLSHSDSLRAILGTPASAGGRSPSRGMHSFDTPSNVTNLHSSSATQRLQFMSLAHFSSCSWTLEMVVTTAPVVTSPGVTEAGVTGSSKAAASLM